ncbi:hypothetical protein M3196_05985 [Fictibacillus nanhaiensis]|nr:hypothetical protein [Fictibacillus nanhaiensis]MCM3731209.1 hypothetical protein [Fictibacillus nanhaiensis]
MKGGGPIEYSKKFLDKRNDLTGPSDAEKRSYPKPPKHVSIQQSNKENQ